MSRQSNEKSLKAQVLAKVSLLTVLDVALVAAIVRPDLLSLSWKELAIGRGAWSILTPFVVLMATHIFPHEVKAFLVYWRWRFLPGCRAFSKYAHSDIRISAVELKKNVGVFPAEPIEQNAKWYKLYKRVAGEPQVAESQNTFLAFRDMAAFSILTSIVVSCVLLFLGESAIIVFKVFVLLFVQYLLCAVSARWAGVRFVCNVLAIHASRKVTTVAAKPNAI